MRLNGGVKSTTTSSEITLAVPPSLSAVTTQEIPAATSCERTVKDDWASPGMVTPSRSHS